MDVSLTGDDTIKVNGRSLVDFADGVVGSIKFPNDLVTMKVGKNNNTIFAFNNSGKQCDVELRIQRGSADDKFLLSEFSKMNNSFSDYVLLTGSFIKQIGDGLGGVSTDTYSMNSGLITHEPEAESQADGATDQGVVIWKLKFANAPRVLS